MRDFYLRYLTTCNAHDFDALDAFVATDVVVNGERQGLDGYVAGLRAVVLRFPDYRWDLQHLLIDGDVLAAHFIDTGTTVDGRAVRTQEFAFYRIAAGRIAEVWVTADDLTVRRQLGEGVPPLAGEPALSEAGALGEKDFDDLAALARRCLESDGGMPLAADPAFLRARWGPPASVPAGDVGVGSAGAVPVAAAGSADAVSPAVGHAGPGAAVSPPVTTIAVRDRDGRLIAAGAAREGSRFVGLVDPVARGRGLGRRLLDWGLQRAGTVETEGLTPAAAELFASRGLRRVFAEDVMRIALPAADRPPAWPDGTELVGWSEATARRFHAVYHAAFRERPGFPDLTAGEWIEAVDEEEFRPDWSVLAVVPGIGDAGFITAGLVAAGSAIAGLGGAGLGGAGSGGAGRGAAGSDSAGSGGGPGSASSGSAGSGSAGSGTAGRGNAGTAGSGSAGSGSAGAASAGVDGWIDQVGVIPSARGRGLGAALIIESLRRMAADGAAYAWLNVNVDNPARDLYRRLGFAIMGRRARFER